MEEGQKIEGLDRFLLISTALLFADIPQMVLYFIPFAWPAGWLWGILGGITYGFITNLAFNVRLFGPRMGMKALVWFIAELIPGIGAISQLSLGMFIITYFHNRNVDAASEESGV